MCARKVDECLRPVCPSTQHTKPNSFSPACALHTQITRRLLTSERLKVQRALCDLEEQANDDTHRGAVPGELCVVVDDLVSEKTQAQLHALRLVSRFQQRESFN